MPSDPTAPATAHTVDEFDIDLTIGDPHGSSRDRWRWCVRHGFKFSGVVAQVGLAIDSTGGYQAPARDFLGMSQREFGLALFELQKRRLVTVRADGKVALHYDKHGLERLVGLIELRRASA